nr:hypothetical protein [Sciscionella marina]
MLVDAARPIGSTAVADGDASPFEVAEELFPFLVRGGPVFLAGAGGATACEEGTVAPDDFFGIDRLVAHGGVDVAVADHELRDVGRHPIHNGIRDEQSPKIMGREQKRSAAGVGEASARKGVVEQAPDASCGDRTVLDADPSLEQQGHRRVPDPFVIVVAHHQRNGSAGIADTADDRAEHVRQLRVDDQKPFSVALGRGDVR